MACICQPLWIGYFHRKREWRNSDSGRKPGRGGSNASIDSVGRRRPRRPAGPPPGTLSAPGAATRPHGSTAAGRTRPAATAPLRNRRGACGALPGPVASATRRRRGRGGQAARIRTASRLFSRRPFQVRSETLASKAIWGLRAAHRTPRAVAAWADTEAHADECANGFAEGHADARASSIS